MLADGQETDSRGGSLGQLGGREEYGPESTANQLARQLRRRWKILGAVVVTTITTAAIYRVDGGVSTDAIVFGVSTLALLLYVVLTIRSDMQLE